MKTGKITTNTTMNLNYFNDFYFLQALRAQIGMKITANPELQFRKSVEKLSRDVQEAADEIIPNIALRTFTYLYAACMGEARHANTALSRIRSLPVTRMRERSEIYAMAADFPANKKNIQALIDIFDQEWNSGYGGPPWKNIAESLNWYYDLPNETFIDHVIDLEHNGGTVFNKEDAKFAIRFETKYTGRLSNFLDYKFSHNILEDFPDMADKLHVTGRVKNLATRYSTIFQTYPPVWMVGDLKRLDDYVIEWGDGEMTVEVKWSEWTDVAKGNEPQASDLLAKAGIGSIYTATLTMKQYKEKMAEVKKTAIGMAGTYATAKLVKEIDKVIKNRVQLAKQYVKVPKAKTIFQVLPVKLRWIAKGFKVFIPVHSKIGKKTESGTLIEINNHYGIPSKAVQHTSPNFVPDGNLYADGHISYEYGKIQLSIKNGNWNFPYKQLEALLD